MNYEPGDIVHILSPMIGLEEGIFHHRAFNDLYCVWQTEQESGTKYVCEEGSLVCTSFRKRNESHLRNESE